MNYAVGDHPQDCLGDPLVSGGLNNPAKAVLSRSPKRGGAGAPRFGIGHQAIFHPDSSLRPLECGRLRWGGGALFPTTGVIFCAGGSGSRTLLLPGHEALDELVRFFLLAARQPGRRCKQQLQPALGRPLLRPGRRVTDQDVDAAPQQVR